MAWEPTAPITQLSASPGEQLGPHLRKGLLLLFRAHLQAAACGANPWDFAVELEVLRNAGLSTCDLRFVERLGLVEVGERDLPIGSCTLGKHMCFILTQAGIEAAQHLDLAAAGAEAGSSSNFNANGTVQSLRLSERDGGADEGGSAVPVWDHARKELRIGEKMVKRYKGRAENQEIVLSAFQEEGWPPRIFDPLPTAGSTNPKSRLQDTIKALNDNQIWGAIRFRGDGTGEGVLWEPVDEENAKGTRPFLGRRLKRPKW
jgi:hypothetical protein